MLFIVNVDIKTVLLFSELYGIMVVISALSHQMDMTHLVSLDPKLLDATKPLRFEVTNLLFLDHSPR